MTLLSDGFIREFERIGMMAYQNTGHDLGDFIIKAMIWAFKAAALPILAFIVDLALFALKQGWV